MGEVTPSGSGGPIRVSGPPQDGPLRIRGGVGGISFQLDELAAGAEKLDALAGKLAVIEMEARRIWEDLIPFQDLPRWTGTKALSAVGESERSVRAVRTELQRISSQVQACRNEYEMAEWRADAARFIGLVSVGDIRDSVTNAITTGRPDDKTAETVVALLGLEASDVARRMKKEPWVADAVGEAGGFGPRPLAVLQEEAVQVELDSSPAGLLERIRRIDAQGQPVDQDPANE